MVRIDYLMLVQEKEVEYPVFQSEKLVPLLQVFLALSTSSLLFTPLGGGGGVHDIVLYGDNLRPEVQTSVPSCISLFFFSKKIPFLYSFHRKRYSFHLPTVKHCIPETSSNDKGKTKESF